MIYDIYIYIYYIYIYILIIFLHRCSTACIRTWCCAIIPKSQSPWQVLARHVAGSSTNTGTLALPWSWDDHFNIYIYNYISNILIYIIIYIWLPCTAVTVSFEMNCAWLVRTSGTWKACQQEHSESIWSCLQLWERRWKSRELQLGIAHYQW